MDVGQENWIVKNLNAVASVKFQSVNKIMDFKERK